MAFTLLKPDGIDLSQTFAFTGSGTGAGGGKVNQMIAMNSASQTTTTGASYVDTTITTSITPSATNSKILIYITDVVAFTHTNSFDDNGMGFRIKRTIGGSASTLVTDSNYEGFYCNKRNGSNHTRTQHMSWHYVDTTHNTTGAITYTHQFALYRGNENAIGRSINDNQRGNMTLMEVLA